ncbi:hypothetical protein BDA99DRAFT_511486 [Phascolomyces articulosus]|uniref:CID domain-containing protein n=1 Tax=Phascolomyces articulosus TaxID=60185 RepID=A0AAD5K911_9FUNG|nr:hypothetical protein BDA99DRAFT_511486 [Phascolomyces articulosus]
MTDSWDRTIFDKELKAILDAKLPVSASKITSLQSLAISHPQHHNYIVQCIIRFIESAPPDYRLAGLYVVDAISRAAFKLVRKSNEHDHRKPAEVEGYIRRFGIVLRDDSLVGCFQPCSTKDKEKVKKTLDIWEQGNIYSKELVEYLKQSFMKDTSGTTQVDLNSTATSYPTSHSSGNVLQQMSTTVSTAPAVDAESLLARISSIGGLGSLTNAISNAPPSQPLPPSQPPLPTAPVSNGSTGLPPALAQLLGINANPMGPAPTAAPLTTAVSSPMASLQHQPLQPQQQQQTMQNYDGNMIQPSSFQPNRNNPTDPRLRSQGSPPHRMDPRTQQQHSMNANNMPLGTRGNQALPSQTARSRPSRWGQDTGGPVQQQQQPPQRQLSPMHTQNNHKRVRDNNWSTEPSMDNHRRQHQHQRRSPPASPRHQQNRPTRRRTSLPGPIPDPTLPKGSIRVVTRTLFVGPLPGWFVKEDVADIFEKYGELHSIIMSKKTKTRTNAFLKYTNRSSLEAAKLDTTELTIENIQVKVNYGFGFGPRKLFDYEQGVSIIPLNELSEDEKSSLVTAPIGGFQGLPVHDQMTIEEPEVEYRPEWKMDENTGTSKPTTSGGGGGRRTRNNNNNNNNNDHHHDGEGRGNRGNRRKRRRFDSDNDQYENDHHHNNNHHHHRNNNHHHEQQNSTADPAWMERPYPVQQMQVPPPRQQQPTSNVSNVPPNFFFDMQQRLNQQEQQIQQHQQQDHRDNGDGAGYYQQQQQQPNNDYS